VTKRADTSSGDRYDLRVDATQLRAPETRDDGTMVFETVIATAGETLDYPWGRETVGEEALSDPAYLDAHEGLSLLIDKHPKGDRVDGGNTKGVRRIGSVLSARWDATSRAAIARIAVHDPKDQRLVKKMRAVSEGYATATREGRQVKRLPNHLVITGTPRAASARLRADAKESVLDPKELLAKLEAQAGELALAKAEAATLKLRADTAEADLERVKTEHVTELAAAETRADTRAVEIASDLVALRTRADALGVTLADDLKTAAEVRSALAVALGCDAETAKDGTRADVWIDASESMRKRGDDGDDGARARRGIANNDIPTYSI